MTQPLRKKGGLGRGLASLIPTGPAESDSGPATLGPRMGDAAADVLLWNGKAEGARGLYDRAEKLGGRFIPRQVRAARIGAYPNAIREFVDKP